MLVELSSTGELVLGGASSVGSLVRWFVLSGAIFCHMSTLLASETLPFFEKLVSFVSRHGIDVHGVRITSFREDKWSSCRCACGRLVLYISFGDSLHPFPLMMKTDCPVIPASQSLWGIFQRHDSSL